MLPEGVGAGQGAGRGVAGRISPALATRRWSSKRMRIRSGLFLWQHLLGAPFLGPVFCFKTIIPDSQEHPLASSRAVPKAVLRWIPGLLHHFLGLYLETISKSEPQMH